MGRVASLDLGELSLGICISDEMQIIPIPIENYIFERFNLEMALERVRKLIEKYSDLDLILLGYPIRTDGGKSSSTLFVEKFNELLKQLNVKIKLVDETNSTQNGIKMLQNTIKDKEKIRKLKDVAAAYIILKDYLETRI